MQDLTTVKLLFPHKAITEEGVQALLARYTTDFVVCNFVEDSQVGANTFTFAVVDVPKNIIPELFKDCAVKDIDTMNSSGIIGAKEKCDKGCGSGSCCTTSKKR